MNHGIEIPFKGDYEGNNATEPGVISCASRFDPYVNNGGTVVGVAGEDFAVVGADTRISIGYTILSRDYCKISTLTPNCVIATSGMEADCVTLHKTLKYRLTDYAHEFKKDTATPAIAQLLSNTLYYRRFFPYYALNLVAGLDQNGKGAVYGYDAVGSYDEVGYGAQGTAADLVQPVLDSQFSRKRPTSIEETRDTVIDVFCSAAERDLYTGDGVDIVVISKDGIHSERLPLRKD